MKQIINILRLKMKDENELKGLGGWLILVGLGVILAPIRLLITYVPLYQPVFEDGTWEAITSVDSVSYNPMLSSLLMGEMAYNVIMVLASIYLIYLFFTKNYLFPKLYIAIFAVSLVFILFDAWLVTMALPDVPMFDSETKKEFFRVLVGGMIWVPYMLLSKRVKLTFVENKPDKILASSVDVD